MNTVAYRLVSLQSRPRLGVHFLTNRPALYHQYGGVRSDVPKPNNSSFSVGESLGRRRVHASGVRCSPKRKGKEENDDVDFFSPDYLNSLRAAMREEQTLLKEQAQEESSRVEVDIQGRLNASPEIEPIYPITECNDEQNPGDLDALTPGPAPEIKDQDRSTDSATLGEQIQRVLDSSSKKAGGVSSPDFATFAKKLQRILDSAAEKVNSRSSESDLARSQKEPETPEEEEERTTWRPEPTPENIVQKTYERDSPDIEMVKSGGWKQVDPLYLRDSCVCDQCVDPSSKQKNFQTTDIPRPIQVTNAWLYDGRVAISFKNDVRGFRRHKGILPENFFGINNSFQSMLEDRFEAGVPQLWDKEKITRKLEFVTYEDYMNTDTGLYRALRQLEYYGLLLVRGVPESEKSVERLAERIGNLRDTLYGRTWDVRSVPQAKNVAYTSRYLGLHMDLLYMANPPGFQFLHCLQNSCEGGASLFSDAFNTACELNDSHWKCLSGYQIPYHYRNAGEHYYYQHPVIKISKRASITSRAKQIKNVNYSPPFQATLVPPHLGSNVRMNFTFPQVMSALRDFAKGVQSEKNLYEYRLEEGECVIFNNRRVLHGRRQFNTAQGSRWLKGAYIDTDVFNSKWRVMREKWQRKEFFSRPEDSTYVDQEVGGRRDWEEIGWDRTVVNGTERYVERGSN